MDLHPRSNSNLLHHGPRLGMAECKGICAHAGSYHGVCKTNQARLLLARWSMSMHPDNTLCKHDNTPCKAMFCVHARPSLCNQACKHLPLYLVVGEPSSSDSSDELGDLRRSGLTAGRRVGLMTTFCSSSARAAAAAAAAAAACLCSAVHFLSVDGDQCNHCT